MRAASSAVSSTTSRPPPSSGTRITIPRPSLVTSSGPSPVRGFMAAMPCTSSSEFVAGTALVGGACLPYACTHGPPRADLMRAADQPDRVSGPSRPRPSSQIQREMDVGGVRHRRVAREDAGVNAQEPAVISERVGPDGMLAIISLNRPEALGALSQDLKELLLKELSAAGTDP